MAETVFLRIGLTLPEEFPDVRKEADAIVSYLESGAINFFHIRKPKSSEKYVRTLIDAIDTRFHNQLILHSHYSLLNDKSFGGIHEKPEALTHFDTMRFAVFKTKSCHSLEDLILSNSEEYKYRFLSPIFDSISKSGYKSAFSIDDKKMQETIMGKSVVALGGVQPHHFSKLFDAKFAGAALLGYLWSPKTTPEKIIRELIDKTEK